MQSIAPNLVRDPMTDNEHGSLFMNHSTRFSLKARTINGYLIVLNEWPVRIGVQLRNFWVRDNIVKAPN